MKRIVSEETRAKMSASHLGHIGYWRGPHSDEAKEKISAAGRGRVGYWHGKKRGPHSPETKLKMRSFALGRKMSLESRALMSVKRKGKAVTPEQRAKISLTLSGRSKTPEHIAKAAAAQVGQKRIVTPAMRKHFDNLSILMKGKPKSEAHVKKVLDNWHRTRYEYGNERFRSTYELRLAKALDAQGIRWLYEPTRFDLGTASYTPDFYLPDLKVYWETKGYFSPESQKKIALFRSLHPDKPLVLANNAVIKMMERIA